MTDMNTSVFVGRIVKDAVLEEKNNVKFSKFSVAVNRDVYKDNEKKSLVSFIDLVIFDTFAEKTSPYIKKGTQVCVMGHIVEKKWTDDKGNHSKLAIAVDKLQLLSSGKKENSTNEKEAENTSLPENEAVTYENNNSNDDEYNSFF